MAFIGKVPTPVPLTSADITDGIISVAKLTSTLDLSSNTVTLPSGVGGKVLQVVSTAKTDSFSTTSSSFTDVTGMSVSITPSSTSSKILIHCRFSTINDTGSRVNAFNLVRNSTAIAQPASSSFTSSVLTISSSTFDNADYSPIALHHLDSPSSTSAITYKLQCRTNDGSTLRVGNRSDGIMSNSSDITVMEIAG